MALSYINEATYDSNNTASIVINKPTNTANGDIMFSTTQSAYDISTAPSGRTNLGHTFNNAVHCNLYYKIASSEGASYTWGLAGSGELASGRIFTFRGGFDTTDAIDVVSNTLYIASNNVCRAASMTVSTSNSPLIYFGLLYSGSSISLTKPSVPTTDWVEISDTYNVTSDTGYEMCTMVWASSGATGNMDGTISISTTNKHAFAVALNPEAAATNTTNFFQFIN